jgi:CDP-diacylglycerol--glycerol-3-phosphate 3-phosphatidyltransferase
MVFGASRPDLYVLLPVWLLIRMVLATIDGTLVVEFGQKSRLGGILNEVGDVVSDVALYAPLVLVFPLSPKWVVLVIVLAVVGELAGMGSEWLGLGRRVEGPMGKSDRSVVFGLVGAWLGVCGSLPAAASHMVPLMALLLLGTIINRVRFAWAEAKRQARLRT